MSLIHSVAQEPSLLYLVALSFPKTLEYFTGLSVPQQQTTEYMENLVKDALGARLEAQVRVLSIWTYLCSCLDFLTLWQLDSTANAPKKYE